MPKTLINFRLDEDTRLRFDSVCEAAGKTRTAVLIDLIEAFILEQLEALAIRKKVYADLDLVLHQLRQKQEITDAAQTRGYPLEWFYSDGSCDERGNW